MMAAFILNSFLWKTIWVQETKKIIEMKCHASVLEHIIKENTYTENVALFLKK